MNIGIVGGGINGLCCAWKLLGQGHKVTLYERDKLMNATSSASSKLLHGGLRYLENGEFRLVREALRERDAWIRRVPEIARPIRLVMPMYKESQRPSWMVSAGLFLYDYLAGNSLLRKSKYLSPEDILRRDPALKSTGLKGGYEFSDGLMDDFDLGQWVANKLISLGLNLQEGVPVQAIDKEGRIIISSQKVIHYDRVLNITGPWAQQLLEKSNIQVPYKLDLVRGSHLILDNPCKHAYLLEVPGEQRIFFILPWKEKTLLGTTEVRQELQDPITCSKSEQDYLLNAYRHYFPGSDPVVSGSFAGLRPLLYSANDPTKATREYVIHRSGKLISVFGGKWTTAMALAEKVTQEI